MTPEYVITSPSRHHIDGHHNHYSSRHVHFNNNNKHSIDPEEASHSNNNNNNLEVSCDDPTQLFLLMNQQLWDSAIIQLQNNPTEARTWITSRTTDGECKWSHLPLHLACLHGPTPAPLQFIEALINTYPHGVQCRNHEDNLPIHLACDCINFNPQFGLQVEGILGMLIQKYPECLNLKDGMGRRPIDILEERGICDKDKMKQSVGRGLSIIKYMKTMGKRSRKKNFEGSPRSVEKRDDEVKPRRGSPRRNLEDHPIDVMTAKERDNIERMYPQTMAAQRRFNNSNKQHTQLPYLPRDGTIVAAYQSTSPHVDRELVIKSHPLQAAMSPLSNHPIPSTSVSSPYNGHPPVSMCTSPSARLNMDPFHYLEAELSSLRGEHQTMEHMLNVKTQSEVDLKDRLSKLMKENEQMKLDYDYLSNKHSETQTKLNETTKALESSNYELKIKKKQEKTASSELALKMAVEDKQNVEIKKLIRKLKEEKVARIEAEDKLETQMKQQIGLEENMEKIVLQNSEADTLNVTLKAEIKELQAELAQRNEEMNHSKSQEIKLLGLLSKMPDQDIVEERKELSSENRELQKELQQTKTKSIEMKVMLVNLNEKYTESQKEIKELQSQLADQKNGINQLLWGEDKVKESSLVEELRVKNKALREVALKAIATTVQQRIDSPSLSTDSSSDDLHELLKSAENTQVVVEDKKNDLDDNQESLEMLRPVVDDAVKVQQDTVEQIQKLLVQTKATKKLTEKINCGDVESLDIEFSLKIVEQITSSSMKMIDSIDIMSKSTELSKSKLVSLLNLQPEDAETTESEEVKEDTDEEEALKKSTRVNEIAAKHLQELENLKTIMSQIPTLTLDKADRQDARKHLELVDSITSVLNNALSKLVRDARQLKLENLTFI